MRLKLLAWWQLLHRSYWFIPGLMSIGALGLAVAVRLMELMADLVFLELPDNFRACLQRHAELLTEDTRKLLRNAADVEDFDRYYQIFSNNAQSARQD